MRLVLCGPDACEVIEAISYVFTQNGDQVQLCDHRLPVGQRCALAEQFEPQAGIFYLPLDPAGEVEEALFLRAWGALIVCLMTDPRSQASRAHEMGASATLAAPFELEALERAVYAASAAELSPQPL